MICNNAPSEMILSHCIVEYLSHHNTYKQIIVATLMEFIYFFPYKLMLYQTKLYQMHYLIIHSCFLYIFNVPWTKIIPKLFARKIRKLLMKSWNRTIFLPNLTRCQKVEKIVQQMKSKLLLDLTGWKIEYLLRTGFWQNISEEIRDLTAYYITIKFT